MSKMELHLQNGYPSPYPEGLSEAEQEQISENVTGAVVYGVVNFQWLHTITIEFADQEAYDRAKNVYGWEPYGRLVLEATPSPEEGYAHPAIKAGDKAYCGFMLVPQTGDAPALTVDEFKAWADNYGAERWHLPDMMRDVFEADRQVAEAIAAGETPEQFIDNIADDLGLYDFD